MPDINLIWQYERPGEGNWIRYLLGNFDIHEINDASYRSIEENSIVVLSSRRSIPVDYIEKCAKIQRNILFHISDESFHGRYSDYRAFNFVLRNYWAAAFNITKIRTLPLGYWINMAAEENLTPCSQRKYIWSFFGRMKSSRPEMYSELRAIHPHKIHQVDYHGNYEAQDYVRTMRSTIFAPCPMGGVILETNRMYEALEAGCIPLVEVRPWVRYYEHILPDFPFPTVTGWGQGRALITTMMRRPEALDALQDQIQDWWQTRKARLKADVTEIVADCLRTPSPKKLTRVIKPFGRLPGWRQFELLRHQSIGSGVRRVRWEAKKFLDGKRV